MFDGRNLLTTLDTPPAIRKRHIGRKSQFFPSEGTPSEYCQSATTFETEKLDWWVYPADGEGLKICLLVSTQYTNATDSRQTDRHRTSAKIATSTTAPSVNYFNFLINDSAHLFGSQ